jgi:hypothetical protein
MWLYERFKRHQIKDLDRGVLVKKFFHKLKCKLGFHDYVKYPIERLYIIRTNGVANFNSYHTTFRVCKHCYYNPEAHEDIEVIEVYY